MTAAAARRDTVVNSYKGVAAGQNFSGQKCYSRAFDVRYFPRPLVLSKRQISPKASVKKNLTRNSCRLWRKCTIWVHASDDCANKMNLPSHLRVVWCVWKRCTCFTPTVGESRAAAAREAADSVHARSSILAESVPWCWSTLIDV